MVAIRPPGALDEDAERSVVARATRHHVTGVWVAGRAVAVHGAVVGASPDDLPRFASPRRDQDAVDLLRSHVLSALRDGPPRPAEVEDE
jgi:hypothetical protein